VSITGCSISNNSGSGLYFYDELTNLITSVQGCTVSGNSGDGIRSAGALTVSDSTISRNGDCGIVDYDDAGEVTVTNCTVWGNSGGGIWNGEPLTLNNCTVSQNHSSNSGGGIYNDGSWGTAVLNNSIIAYNTSGSGPDVAGSVTANYCLIGDPSQATFTSTTTDQIGTHAAPLDPLIAWLGAYGGPTMPDGTTMPTAPPLPGSLAIDAGSNLLIPNGITTDERGFNRIINATGIINATVDIGACESGGFSITLASGNNQIAAPGTTFGEPLVVNVIGNTVAGLYGNVTEPVNVGNVVFTANAVGGASATFPSSGLSVVVATIESGQASESVQANSVAGSYTVTASIGTASPATFTLTNVTPAQPTVTFVSPLQGPLAGNTPVTITGSGFTGATAVDFGTTAAINPVIISATEITATSAAGTAGTVHVTVTGPGGTSTTSSADQFTYLPASQFVVAAVPTSITAGNNVVLVVTAEDASGNVVTSYAGTVRFTSSDPLEPAPATNLTFTAGSGMAYAVATLETVGSWAITATDTTFSSIHGASAAVTVTAASASKVVFSQQPAATSVGATIPVTARVEDIYGNVVSTGSGSTDSVTLAIASGPGGGKLLGATNVQASGGVATFSNLSIQQSGTFTLSAGIVVSFGTLNATSNPFTITPGAATQLVFTTQPSPSFANTAGTETEALSEAVVDVEDTYGNLVTGDNSSVTLSLNQPAAGNGGGGVLYGTGVSGGTVTEIASGGVATFSGLSIVNSSNSSYSAAGTGYSLAANDTDNGTTLTAGTSAAFNTTMIVSNVTMTPTGFVATFSQPFNPNALNLYGSLSSANERANVSLAGNVEGPVRGSLVINSADTQVTFVATTLASSTGLAVPDVSSGNATSGVLAPDTYGVLLASQISGIATYFATANGQPLDGTYSGTGGTSFNQYLTVNNAADVAVIVPDFARGPSSTSTSTVNVANLSTPITATGAVVNTMIGDGAVEGSSTTTVTITTTTAHTFAKSAAITITGVPNTAYDGTFTVRAATTNSTTFTYTDTAGGEGLNPSGGGTVSYSGGSLSILGMGASQAADDATVTINLTTPNAALVAGDLVTITGVVGYTGSFYVTHVNSNTSFQYSDPTASQLTPTGGGTVTMYTGGGLAESGNTVTITTTVANDLVAGDPVTISNAGVLGYDGTFTVASAVAGGTTFTYTDSTTGLPSSGGGTAALARGIPISLSGPTAGVTSGTFTLTYNPTLLNISSALVDSSLAANYGATLAVSTSTPGTAVISFSTTKGLPAATTSISQASESGNTVTITTLASTVQNLTVGEKVTIAGFYDQNGISDYNGTFAVLSASGTTFTYTDAASGLGTATGIGTVNTPILLGGLMATVPSAAPYKSKNLLHFSSASVSAGSTSVPTIGADALDLVALPGDTAGLGTVGSSDVLQIEQVLDAQYAGFSAFPLVDPNIIGDVGEGVLNGHAASLFQNSVNLGMEPQIPAFPGKPVIFGSGPDPTVSMPSALQVGSDGTVTVPVNIDDPAPAGSTGMMEATLALSYDPAVFSVSSSDIQLGSVPASGSGWMLQSTVDAATGQIGVTIWSGTPITSSAAGSLVTIVFHRSDLAASGTTTIDLVPSVEPSGSGVIYTQVGDGQGLYTLAPAPSDGYDPQIDSLVSLGVAAADATGPASASAGATGSASASAGATCATVADTALAIPPQLVASVVAGPMAPVGVGAAAAVAGPVSAINVSVRSSVSAGVARVPQHMADGLFAALGRGAVDAAELVIAGSGADLAVRQALAAQMSAAGSAQANLDRLVWGADGATDWLDASGQSSTLKGKRNISFE
jgi:hypothetical protein